MPPGIAEGPSPPPERASWRICLFDLQLCSSECGMNTVYSIPSGGTCISWLIDLVCSVGLPVLIHYVLRPPPPTTPPTPLGSGSQRRVTPPSGLIEIVRSSPLPRVARSPWLTRAAADYIPRPILLTGEPLVEIFAVSADFPFVGTIGIGDSRGCKTIYMREDWGREYTKFFSRKEKWLSSDRGHSALISLKDQLVLTGPSRTIAVYFCGFVIALDIPARKKKKSEYHKLFWNAEEDLSMHDKPRTVSIVTKRGCVYVTCAVVSAAVEACVQVVLRLPCEVAACAKVHGHIDAPIDTFGIGCTLFSKDVDEAVDVSVSRDVLPQGHSDLEFCHPIVLPLDRSILAVPVGGRLQVKGELVFTDLMWYRSIIQSRSKMTLTSYKANGSKATSAALLYNCLSGHVDQLAILDIRFV